MEQKNQVIPPRIRASLLASISAGVVPRAGAPYIAIGRTDEINAVLSDLEDVNAGGGATRFLIGRYGSGKSFLIQLVRGYALERDFLTADCDLSPERRLCGGNKSGLATYRELMKNLASKASPDGGALPKILSRWLTSIRNSLLEQGVLPDSEEFVSRMNVSVRNSIADIENMVGGFDFVRVLVEYYRASISDSEISHEREIACLRWLRGEFATKTEAKRDLGFSVSLVIDDDNWYDFVKILATLSQSIGYRGLVVFIDECVNLYKIPNRISRESNYEKILSIFNDTLQGRAPGLCVIFGGTPQFLEDTRRGLFSYEALRSRLCDSRFALEGYKNLLGPVIRLKRLSNNELYALLVRVTAIYSAHYKWNCPLNDEDMQRFLSICLSRAGAESLITPREMLRDYMTVLGILMQNPSADFSDILKNTVTLKTDREDEDPVDDNDSVDDQNTSLVNDLHNSSTNDEQRIDSLRPKKMYSADDIEF